MELRLPNITGATVEERLQQLQSYLYSTIEQLNWAFSVVEKEYDSVKQDVETVVADYKTPEKAEKTFSEIKDLIIKSADIVESYREEMKRDYDERYVAQSDIGTYVKEGTTAIIEGPEGIGVRLQSVEKLTNENKEAIAKNEGYIQIGKIGENADGDIIGVLIKDGAKDGSVFARYTADGTILYNEAAKETIKISDGRTKLTGRVEIKNAPERQASLGVGGYVLDPTYGIGLYWGGE